MKTVGVICEFNPFHNGHKYLIESIREQLGGCCIVGIMSGSFVQRGDVAIADKFSRANAALNNGVDLIAELPTVYAVSSGEIFAKAGVSIAHNLGCDVMAFGVEGDRESLIKTAEIQSTEQFKNQLKKQLTNGLSYPAAVEKSLVELWGKENAEVLSEPNNILGIEYIKAATPLGIDILPIKRTGVHHDSHRTNGDFASASQIRNMLLNNDLHSFDYLPDYSYLSDPDSLCSVKNIEGALLYKLRTMTPGDFAVLPDVTEGLENRIFQAVKNYNSIPEIIDAVKTKRYTHARLRRIMIYALLGITKEMQCFPVPYVRILGFNKPGEIALKSAAENCRLPIITRTANGLRQLDGISRTILEKDILASDILNLAKKSPQKCGDDYCKALIKA